MRGYEIKLNGDYESKIDEVTPNKYKITRDMFVQPILMMNMNRFYIDPNRMDLIYPEPISANLTKFEKDMIINRSAMLEARGDEGYIKNYNIYKKNIAKGDMTNDEKVVAEKELYVNLQEITYNRSLANLKEELAKFSRWLDNDTSINQYDRDKPLINKYMIAKWVNGYQSEFGSGTNSEFLAGCNKVEKNIAPLLKEIKHFQSIYIASRANFTLISNAEDFLEWNYTDRLSEYDAVTDNVRRNTINDTFSLKDMREIYVATTDAIIVDADFLSNVEIENLGNIMAFIVEIESASDFCLNTIFSDGIAKQLIPSMSLNGI
ncbi:Uncharacterised protein [Yersinia aldovae]|uniref:hypothetical protein n=1 Tax=Yersinia aldovae TaxID=29483 RepID=UPI0005E13515|nr:hypothetical protein [Yersinia aldovae]CNJ11002.1 Uncharacterised protein [Yersinia aldovae]